MNNWICNSNYSFDDKNFCKIFDFFVLKTPVKEVSYKGITFKKRNFKDANEVNRAMRKLFSDLFLCFIPIKNDKDSIEETLKMNGIKENIETPFEFAIFKIHENFSITDSFFYYIRCAFAHGSFCIHDFNNMKYYYLENVHRAKKQHKPKLYARMILKEETLLGIIELCNSKMET